MSSQAPKNCFEKPLRQFDIRNSIFIDSVHDEQFREQILENVFKQSTRENPQLRNVKYTIDLCTELKEEQRKKFVEENRRQQLRQNNEELKILEQQIRAGYVMRTVQSQIFEKEAIAKKLKAEEEAESNRLLLAQMKLQNVDEEMVKSKQKNLKRELAEQVAQKKELLREKYLELIKERQIMDEAIKKYKKDVEKEEREEREKLAKTRRDLDDHVQAKLQHGMEQDQAWEEEEKRYQQLLMIREEERQKEKEASRKKALQKQHISEEIGKHIHAVEVEKAKKRELLADLLCEEREAKETLQMKEYLQKQQHNKMLALQEMERVRIEKEEEKLAEKKAEEAYFLEEMRILAERDKLEQLSDAKRRKKQMEHRKSLQDAFNNQKLRKAEEMKGMIRTREELVKEDEKRERLVREERIRMLKEHAHILKYCAPGVVSDSEKKVLKTQSSLN